MIKDLIVHLTEWGPEPAGSAIKRDLAEWGPEPAGSATERSAEAAYAAGQRRLMEEANVETISPEED
eukprot:8386585-Heterocapsa_arctica.AAC.1